MLSEIALANSQDTVPELKNAGQAPTLTDFMPANPLRPLDHRWQLARCLVEHPLPVRPRWIDAWTRRARRFHRIRQKRLDLSRRFHPERVDAGIHQALQIHHQPRRRLELEARLLAGQDDDTIAQRLKLPPDLVELYDRLFFDVRDHRNGRDFILARILGSGPARGQLSREQVVHLIAYMRGPVVVDGVLEVYDTPEKSALFATETQSRLEMDPLRLLFEIKQLGAWGTLPVPVRRLLTLTVQRLDPGVRLDPTSGVLGEVDLDAILTEYARTGDWEFLEPRRVPPNTQPETPEVSDPVPARRVRYAT